MSLEVMAGGWEELKARELTKWGQGMAWAPQKKGVGLDGEPHDVRNQVSPAPTTWVRGPGQALCVSGRQARGGLGRSQLIAALVGGNLVFKGKDGSN